MSDQSIITFRLQYRKYIEQMDSHDFAKQVIHNGILDTKIKIILQMKDQGYQIPSKLLDFVEKTGLDINIKLIKDFFDNKKIFTQKDYESNNSSQLYREFYDWVKELGYVQVPSKLYFTHWLKEQEVKEKRIKSLTDEDCKLIKLTHIK